MSDNEAILTSKTRVRCIFPFTILVELYSSIFRWLLNQRDLRQYWIDRRWLFRLDKAVSDSQSVNTLYIILRHIHFIYCINIQSAINVRSVQAGPGIASLPIYQLNGTIFITKDFTQGLAV